VADDVATPVIDGDDSNSDNKPLPKPEFDNHVCLQLIILLLCIDMS